jgi:molybdate transport system ATP-binding protein
MSSLSVRLTIPVDRFNVDVQWETSEPSLGIFGHSGAGKTTLLEAIAGLRSQARGRLVVGGETWLDSGLNLPPEKRGVGYVPQEGLLFPHLDVQGNLLAGASRKGAAGTGEIELERVLDVLELQPYRDAPIARLSGGEKQRVALGRALCSQPRLLLLDEPLAGLDLPLRRRILPYLIRVREEFSLPTIFVSHDATEMRLLCREMLILEKGKVLASGPATQVAFEASLHPAFRDEGFENVLRGSVVQEKESGLLLELEKDCTVLVPRGEKARPATVMVGLRAEDILISLGTPAGLSAQNSIHGTVREIRRLGVDQATDSPVWVTVAYGGQGASLVASITPQACSRLSLAEGKEVDLIFKAQSCRILAAG